MVAYLTVNKKAGQYLYYLVNTRSCMLPSTDTVQRTDLDIIYDQYSGSLYGIMLKLSNDHAESESVLIRSFSELFSQKFQVSDRCIFIKLLKIAIPLIAEHTDLSKEEIKKILLTDHHQLLCG